MRGKERSLPVSSCLMTGRRTSVRFTPATVERTSDGAETDGSETNDQSLRDRDAHTCPWMPTDDRQRRSFAACCVNLRGIQLSYAVVCIDQTCTSSKKNVK